MNEITRIHLAKVPYNIEIQAKKELQKYLDAIKAYAGDSDLVNDVESRMVEILSDRHIVADGIISLDDIKALKEQLGEPEEFSGDDQAEVVPAEDDGKPMHRLYRDTTQSWLGGVAAGIARYYGIQAIWVRLIFVALALASFGSVVLIYVVLWLIIPPAKTAADLLQLEGKPATVSAIHALNERGLLINSGRDHKIARFFSVAFGILATLAAASVFVGTVTFSVLGLHNNANGMLASMNGMTGNTGISWLIFSVVIAGLMLFVVLMSLIAYGLLSWRYTRRLIISGVVVVILGLAAVATTAILVGTSQADFQQQLNRAMVSKTYDLPTNFKNISDLELRSSNIDTVDYIVSNSSPKIVVDSLPGGTQPSVAVNNVTATVVVNEPQVNFGRFYRASSVKIYGPALTNLKISSGHLSYDGSNTMADKVDVNVVGDSSQLTIYHMQINSLQAEVDDQATLDATGAAVHDALLTVASAGHVSLANIANLTLSAPNVCASDSSPITVDVANVNSSDISYNGNKINAKTFADACVELTVGGRQ